MNTLEKMEKSRFGKVCVYHLYTLVKGVDPEIILFFSQDGTYSEDFLRLYRALGQAPQYEGLRAYFATLPHRDAPGLPHGCLHVSMDSVDFVKKCAAARYIISDSPLPAFMMRTKEQRVLYIPDCQTIDALKKESPGGALGSMFVQGMLRNRISHILWPGADSMKKKNRHRAIHWIEEDFPRNESLLYHTLRDVVRSRLAMHVPFKSRVVLFALETQLSSPSVLLEGMEPNDAFVFYDNTTGTAQVHNGMDPQKPLRTRPLARSVFLLACDVLVTDSPCLADEYGKTGKNQIIFHSSQGVLHSAATLDTQNLEGIVAAIAGMSAQALNEKLEQKQINSESTSFSVLEQFITPQIRFTKKKRWNMNMRRTFRFIKVKWKGLLRRTGLVRTENDKRLAAYHNAHQGGRCFLIGNGPSLTIADLNLLQGEISFSCNLIYKIFDLTDWRPTYHFLIDGLFAQNYDKEIAEQIKAPFFTMEITKELMRTCPPDTTYAYPVFKTNYRVRGNMLDYYVPSNATVMSYMIEMALHMGFTEIYLLGVDCSNTLAKNSHFIQDYRPESLRKQEESVGRKKVIGSAFTALEYGEYNRNRSIDAYKKLGDYAQGHGVQVVNCTRGGLLEVFERARLEDVVRK